MHPAGHTISAVDKAKHKFCQITHISVPLTISVNAHTLSEAVSHTPKYTQAHTISVNQINTGPHSISITQSLSLLPSQSDRLSQRKSQVVITPTLSLTIPHNPPTKFQTTTIFVSRTPDRVSQMLIIPVAHTLPTCQKHPPKMSQIHKHDLQAHHTTGRSVPHPLSSQVAPHSMS